RDRRGHGAPHAPGRPGLPLFAHRAGWRLLPTVAGPVSPGRSPARRRLRPGKARQGTPPHGSRSHPLRPGAAVVHRPGPPARPRRLAPAARRARQLPADDVHALAPLFDVSRPFRARWLPLGLLERAAGRLLPLRKTPRRPPFRLTCATALSG